ncbi:MAG: NAD-dependent succinate-semialdehyde dehydrogenase, partial [Burkholderiales bacterium]|nr:NAD-dependent succinate-semialdehyde dehydrogenase [Burkholderiales bacterium]
MSTPAQRPDRNAWLREQAYVGGRWITAGDGAVLTVHDPASGALLGSVPRLSAAEVEAAIAAAAGALGDWGARTAAERAAVLRRWHELMRTHEEALARLLTAEQGKPLAEARSEIAYAASFFEWFAEEARRAYGEVIPSPWPERRVLTLRQPAGVAALITPWNFPSAMLARKAAAALAAGCTVVAKPASATPFSALALAALGEQAGLPAGVFNVVTGEAATIGAVLTADPRVRVLSFTGSRDTGRKLMAACAGTVKRVTLELGGNAPFIVFDDADLDLAVEGAVASKFRNCGQTCVCANRILVQSDIYDAFAQRFAARVAALKVGPGWEEGVQLGPLIDEAAVAKVEAHVQDAVQQGAHVLTGGRRHALGGRFYEPTVLTRVELDMRVCREETFGPVAPLMRFDTEAQAVQLANATEYGLAAYFYTRDLGRAWRVAEALEYGMVGVNAGVISTAVAPFGGIKQSGLGREGGR